MMNIFADFGKLLEHAPLNLQHWLSGKIVHTVQPAGIVWNKKLRKAWR